MYHVSVANDIYALRVFLAEKVLFISNRTNLCTLILIRHYYIDGIGAIAHSPPKYSRTILITVPVYKFACHFTDQDADPVIAMFRAWQ